MSLIRWLPAIVSGSDQVVDVAFGEARFTLIVLALPHVVRLSWR